MKIGHHPECGVQPREVLSGGDCVRTAYPSPAAPCACDHDAVVRMLRKLEWSGLSERVTYSDDYVDTCPSCKVHKTRWVRSGKIPHEVSNPHRDDCELARLLEGPTGVKPASEG